MSTLTLAGPVRRLTMTILFGLLFGQAEAVFASTFVVNPVSLTLSASQRSALLTITNSGSDDVRLQLDTFDWKEGAAGEALLTPTDDLVVFPLATTVHARQSVNIRIGLSDRSSVPVERNYRIKVEELPSAVRREEVAVAFTMTMSIPVFVQPARPKGAVSIANERVSERLFRFSLANPANAHVRLTAVVVKGIGPAGEKMFSKELPAWYLLAGGVRNYEVPLDPAECSGATELLVETRSSQAGAVASRTARTPDGCASGRP